MGKTDSKNDVTFDDITFDDIMEDSKEIVDGGLSSILGFDCSEPVPKPDVPLTASAGYKPLEDDIEFDDLDTASTSTGKTQADLDAIIDNVVGNDKYKTTSTLSSKMQEIKDDIDSKPKAKRKTFIKSIDIVSYLHSVGQIISESIEGDENVYYIHCPNEGSHSTVAEKDTMIFVSDGKLPRFFCHHAGCSGMTLFDWIKTQPGIKPYIQYESEDITEEIDVSEAKSKSNTDGLDEIDKNIICFGITIEGKLALASTDNPNILYASPSDITSKFLILLYSHFPAWFVKFNKGGKTPSLNLDQAMQYLTRRCKAAGLFDKKDAKLLGIYNDELGDKKVIVANTGNGVYCEGKMYGYIESWSVFKRNHYERYTRTMSIAEKPASMKELAQLVEIINKLPMCHKYESQLLLATIAAGMIGGVIKQRPVLKLSGPTGSGKSEILNKVIRPLLLVAGGMVCDVGTTAAGLEQSAGGAVPIILDEIEPDSRRNTQNIDSILEMILSSVTDLDSKIYKGTKDGKGIQRSMRSSYYLASVEDTITKPTLLRRITFLTLRPTPESRLGWSDLDKQIGNLLTKEYCSKVFKYLYERIPSIQRLQGYLAFKMQESTKHENYVIQLYTTLMACYYHFIYDFDNPNDEGTKVYAKIEENCNNVIEYIVNKYQKTDTDMNSGLIVLQKIIGLMIPIDSSTDISISKKSIQDLIYDVYMDEIENSKDALLNIGIDICTIKGIDSEKYLVISNSHIQIKNLLEKNGIMGHSNSLMSIKGAIRIEIKRFKHIRTRAVAIPLSEIFTNDDVTKTKKTTFITQPLEDLI